jgi:hypothetical protein
MLINERLLDYDNWEHYDWLMTGNYMMFLVCI